MQPTLQDLFLLIGELTYKNRVLEAQLAQAQADKPTEPPVE